MDIATWGRRIGMAGMLLVASAALAQPERPASRVLVRYDHPQTFAEMHGRQPRFGNESGAWLGKLKSYIEKRAARRLPAGQHLAITITDVKLAGNYEPWLGPRLDDVRIIRDIYPPRIDLRFELQDADGRILRSGSRKLRDIAFMDSVGPADTDTLRYEKALIDKWLRKGPQAL